MMASGYHPEQATTDAELHSAAVNAFDQGDMTRFIE
jgi:hypothetical protein